MCILSVMKMMFMKILLSALLVSVNSFICIYLLWYYSSHRHLLLVLKTGIVKTWSASDELILEQGELLTVYSE